MQAWNLVLPGELNVYLSYLGVPGALSYQFYSTHSD
jgi:hypothetical protein